MLTTMFDQAVEASEAQRETLARGQGTSTPALQGCLDCRTVALIAAPMLGTCTDCGAALIILRPDQI